LSCYFQWDQPVNYYLPLPNLNSNPLFLERGTETGPEHVLDQEWLLKVLSFSPRTRVTHFFSMHLSVAKAAIAFMPYPRTTRMPNMLKYCWKNYKELKIVFERNEKYRNNIFYFSQPFFFLVTYCSTINEVSSVHIYGIWSFYLFTCFHIFP
jgi:hypothetical protein